MELQITSREGTGVERRLRISVPADTVRAAKERAASKVAKHVRLPGFRPGKAPAAMVRKQFAQAIEQEALESLMQEAYTAVVEQEKLEPVTQPHAHDVSFKDGEPLTFELHCEVKPTIELAKVDGFRVMRPVSTVTEEQVTQQLEQLREQRGNWAPAEGKPKEGDLVHVTLAITGEGEEAAAGKEYRIVLGAGQAIAAVEEVLMGLTAGESVERAVRWPDDFPDEAQRGKTKTVQATLHEVKRKALPALDDAFARELGDFDSVDALTAAVRKDLEESAVREADAAARTQLLDEIIAANPFDVPPSWVRNLTQAYLQGYGVPEAEHEQFAAQFLPVAEKQVRRELVIETLAVRETLAATEADVDAKVVELAEARGAKAGEVYAQLEKAGRLREIERGITEARVFTWLMERNTIEQA